MTKIYHLALAQDWHLAVNDQRSYYPPTYDQDGFVHGTADPAKLLEVANHFYTESQGDWLCLEMTEASLAAKGVTVKFEAAAAVGDQPGELGGEPILFPHIFGGIHPQAVTATHAVQRDVDGNFTSIELEA
jgi:uncharacterized protein (DUF952 family)